METSQSSTGTTPPNMPAPSTYSQADSPASLSAWLANARAQTTNATCSLKLSKRLRLYNREFVFLKTSPASSPARPLSKFTARSTGSAIDPNPHWCLEVLTAETSTNENACGFTPPVRIPTIGANEYKGSGRARYRGSPEYRGAKASEGLRTSSADPIYLTPSFAEWMMNFPIGSSGLKPLATDKTQS